MVCLSHQLSGASIPPFARWPTLFGLVTTCRIVHGLELTVSVLQLFQIMSKAHLVLIELLHTFITSPCHCSITCIALFHFINSKQREYICVCIWPICLVKLVENQIRPRNKNSNIYRHLHCNRSDKYTIVDQTNTN